MYNSNKDSNFEVSKDIFPSEAWELISQNVESDGLIIIDVSTPQEHEVLHLEGAINVSLLSRFFKARMDIMDKSKTYVVYCKVGGRSKIAQKLMVRLGFQKVYNITGGTLLWEEEGLPFASGIEGANKFSFCPFFISIVAAKKIKKIWLDVVSCIGPPKGVAAPSGQES
jgi:rhodanese-related sulfurtransferase